MYVYDTGAITIGAWKKPSVDQGSLRPRPLTPFGKWTRQSCVTKTHSKSQMISKGRNCLCVVYRFTQKALPMKYMFLNDAGRWSPWRPVWKNWTVSSKRPGG